MPGPTEASPGEQPPWPAIDETASKRTVRLLHRPVRYGSSRFKAQPERLNA